MQALFLRVGLFLDRTVGLPNDVRLCTESLLSQAASLKEKKLVERVLELARRMMSDVEADRPTYERSAEEIHAIWREVYQIVTKKDEPQFRVGSLPSIAKFRREGR